MFSNLLMAIYVPYWWIPVTAVTLFISYFMVISAIKWFPRDRNKLILREWRVKFKNGDERTIQFWIPRYAAQYTGDHYLFETYDALKKNSKAKYFRFVSPNDPFYYS